MRLSFVSQSNRGSGCGPACLAMLMRLDGESPEAAYDRAVALLFPAEPGRSRRLRTVWADLQAALHLLRIETAPRVRKHRSFEAISGVSIVKVGDQAGGNWHWIIYDGREKLVYNPLNDGPRLVSSRIARPREHLPIGPGSKHL